MTPAERFRVNASRFTELVSGLADAQWVAPTPCEGWTARDVFGHVATTEADFYARMTFGAPNPLDGAPPSLGDWAAIRDRIQAALDDPARADLSFDGYFGPTTFAATIDQFYSADLTVHVWDIATAVGATDFVSIDPTEMDLIAAGFASLGDAMYQPGLFASPPEVAADASAQTKFLARLGRVG